MAPISFLNETYQGIVDSSVISLASEFFWNVQQESH